jgi:hypothetical protein
MCIEIFNERMTVSEARRALPELIDTAVSEEALKHYKELQEATDEELLELVEPGSKLIFKK